jgi:RNA polymerase sigma-70 factor (ECF subfamily)
MTLEEILKNIPAGGRLQEQALLELYRLKGKEYQWYFIRKGVNPTLVEDVLQEVLISIHKARHTYDGERPIMPWLMSIARFRIIDHLRKHYAQMRHKTFDLDDWDDVTEEFSSDESIDDLLGDVDAKHKEILTMMHVEGYTAKEVGAKIGMNESAVKVAAHRAIKKIRAKLKI